jgi:hypothetical protein
MCAYVTSPPDIDPQPIPMLLKLRSAKQWGSVEISVFRHAHFIYNEICKYYFNFIFHFSRLNIFLNWRLTDFQPK